MIYYIDLLDSVILFLLSLLYMEYVDCCDEIVNFKNW